MFKVTHCSKIVATNNVISRQCFITYMGEEPSESNPNILEFNIKNCKSYDSYNCHLYNYCGVVNVENSDFGMCGGPVLIADHGRFADADGAEVLDVNNLVYKVNGYAPTSVFKNCTFNNYVAGTEAWFTQMGASGLVPDIKALSDLYAPYGMTYAVDQNHRPIIVSSASGDTISMFNFIALNKVSGESLSAVQSPAGNGSSSCGPSCSVSSGPPGPALPVFSSRFSFKKDRRKGYSAFPPAGFSSPDEGS